MFIMLDVYLMYFRIPGQKKIEYLVKTGSNISTAKVSTTGVNVIGPVLGGDL